jgi:hypothetical protein
MDLYFLDSPHVHVQTVRVIREKSMALAATSSLPNEDANASTTSSTTKSLLFGAV